MIITTLPGDNWLIHGRNSQAQWDKAHRGAHKRAHAGSRSRSRRLKPFHPVGELAPTCAGFPKRNATTCRMKCHPRDACWPCRAPEPQVAVWRVCRLRLPASLQPGVGVDDVLPLRAHDLVHTVDLVAQLVEHFQAGVGIAAAANLCSGEDKG